MNIKEDRNFAYYMYFEHHLLIKWTVQDGVALVNKPETSPSISKSIA